MSEKIGQIQVSYQFNGKPYQSVMDVREILPGEIIAEPVTDEFLLPTCVLTFPSTTRDNAMMRSEVKYENKKAAIPYLTFNSHFYKNQLEKVQFSGRALEPHFFVETGVHGKRYKIKEAEVSGNTVPIHINARRPWLHYRSICEAIISSDDNKLKKATKGLDGFFKKAIQAESQQEHIRRVVDQIRLETSRQKLLTHTDDERYIEYFIDFGSLAQ